MSLLRKLSKAIVILVGALTLASCQRSLTMWVIPGSSAEHLVFGFSTTRDGDEKIQPAAIRVYPCASIGSQASGSYYPGPRLAVWDASSPLDALPTATNRVTYGQGFTQSSSKPLTAPGCYVVYASARYRDAWRIATMGFKIAANGIASDMPSNEYDDLFR